MRSADHTVPLVVVRRPGCHSNAPLGACREALDELHRLRPSGP